MAYQLEFRSFPLQFSSLEGYSKLVVITDERVHSLLGEFDRNILTLLIPPGENGKTLAAAEYCWRQMAAFNVDRSSLVIAIGGGSVTDLAGFVAACYMRGIDHINIPTTLLGMVDASIGGKTAVNLGTFKNYIGAFHHPKQVWIYPQFLATLPKRELAAGLAEVIKAAIVADAPFFAQLENSITQIMQGDMGGLQQVIARSCEIKAEIVAADEKDQNLRAVLNFGHTFGHAIESATHFNRFLHGEAVALGMVLEANLSRLLGYCEQTVVERIRKICQQIGLPTELSDVSPYQILEMMKGDKKNRFGKLSLIVVEKIGKVVSLRDIDTAMLEKTLGCE